MWMIKYSIKMNESLYQQKLYQHIQTVANKRKDDIYMECIELFQQYKNFTPSTYSMQSMGKHLSLFQLEGFVMVEYQGKELPVKTQIQFRETYPEIMPIIKYCNPDPAQHVVNASYSKFQNVGEHSIQIPIDWNPRKDKLLTVLQSQVRAFSKDFPFFRKHPAPKNDNEKAYEQIVALLTQDVLADIRKQRYFLDQVKQNHRRVCASEKEMANLEFQIEVGKESARVSWNRCSEFIAQNDQHEPTQSNAEGLIHCDALSSQMIELTAKNQAIRDTYRYISEQFKREWCSLELVVAKTRHLAEEEFYNKYLLRKCAAHK